MIYLKRQTGAGDRAQIDIAAVEDARSAAQYEARGYQHCSFEAFREAWRLRDLRALEQIRATRQELGAARGVYPVMG